MAKTHKVFFQQFPGYDWQEYGPTGRIRAWLWAHWLVFWNEWSAVEVRYKKKL